MAFECLCLAAELNIQTKIQDMHILSKPTDDQVKL